MVTAYLVTVTVAVTPIGALNPTRKSFFVERYNNWESDTIPAFHYSTHYSTADFTLYWLIRLEPFTTYYLNLHENKFDHANRTFHSIPLSWQNCQRDSSDVKELIPELFSLPEMLNNCNNYNFGQNDDELKIDNVILPKWAQTPEDFIRINRAALKSEFVSSHLHQWIDLIFSYKQRGYSKIYCDVFCNFIFDFVGPEAIRAINVFYYLTYEGAVNFDAITNSTDRATIEAQIKNFGQAPSQILTEPHPPRNSAIPSNPTMHHVAPEDVSMIMKFSSNAPIIHVAANTNSTISTQVVITISNKHDFSINKYNPNAGASTSTYSEPPQTLTGQQAQLPLSMDSRLVLNTGLHRRHLGDNFDECIQRRHQSFVVTADNRFIISTGYCDKSFRVQNTDMARTTQVLYGHFDIVTCTCRSDITIAGNCFIATGSRDSTVCIWIWNGTKGAVVDKEYPNQEINPSPAVILTGHDTEIVCLWISAELGVVSSGSEHGLVLQHTLQGDILRAFENPCGIASPRLLSPSTDGDIIVCYDRSKLCLYTLNGKLMRQAIFEEETIQSLILNADGQYTVIGGDRGFVQILRTHDLQPVYAYPQCDASDSNKLQVLVPDGIGFIGSHCVIELINAGYEPIVVDNLSNSSIVCLQRVEQIVGCKITNYKIDCLDLESLRDVFKRHSIFAIMNFAAMKSVEKPVLYYKNNVGSLLKLLTCMKEFNIKNFLFSSSATVYGAPNYLPLDEKYPWIGDAITNPYGKSKYVCEHILKDRGIAHPDWNIIILRYFNPVGAHESGLIGEDPIGKPNNLMPYVAQVTVGRLPHMNVTDTDYDTPDGTDVRDYIHVVDLATGHIACMKKFKENCGLQACKGYSVLEMIKALEKASGKTIAYKECPRRSGDLASVDADPAVAAKELGWKAERSLDDICRDLWR
ncbi:unnamed protein product [Rotaria sp. Silwood2]|nr:unnamed protein product [Rotaria sp. Silwood2]